MASLDFHLVEPQLSVEEINVITIARLYYLQKEIKTKILTWTESAHLLIHELPVQKILHCWKWIALPNLVHMLKKYLLNLYVPGTSNTETNMTDLYFKEFKVYSLNTVCIHGIKNVHNREVHLYSLG